MSFDVEKQGVGVDDSEGKAICSKRWLVCFLGEKG